MNDFHDRKVCRDNDGNSVYADANGHRRTYCKNCGIALNVGGGCVCCKPLKSVDKR